MIAFDDIEKVAETHVIIGFTPKGGKDVVIVIDAATVQTHTSSAKVTEFPVETGSTVSDDVQTDPDVIHLECFVSDAPLASTGEVWTDERPRSHVVYEQLLELKNKHWPAGVATRLRLYEEVYLTSLSITRDKESAFGLAFTAEFRQVEVAESKTVQVKYSARKVNKGNQGTKGKETKQATKEPGSAFYRSYQKNRNSGSLAVVTGALDELTGGIFGLGPGGK